MTRGEAGGASDYAAINDGWPDSAATRIVENGRLAGAMGVMVDDMRHDATLPDVTCASVSGAVFRADYPGNIGFTPIPGFIIAAPSEPSALGDDDPDLQPRRADDAEISTVRYGIKAPGADMRRRIATTVLGAAALFAAPTANATMLIDKLPVLSSSAGLASSGGTIHYDDFDFKYDVELMSFTWWGTYTGDLTFTIQKADADGRPDPGAIVFRTAAAPSRTDPENSPFHDRYTYSFDPVAIEAGAFYFASIATTGSLYLGSTAASDHLGWYDRACADAGFGSACTLTHVRQQRWVSNLANPAVRYEGSVVAAVPEPSTWAMMILGFGAIGLSVRRSRSARAFATVQH